MRTILVFLLLMSIILTSMIGLAEANCWYNGKRYPTGTVIGGLVCQADGSWK
jgi:hypothetical protein